MSFVHLQGSLEQLLSAVTPAVGGIIDRALSGSDISIEEGEKLFDAAGADLLALLAAADQLRARTVGVVAPDQRLRLFEEMFREHDAA